MSISACFHFWNRLQTKASNTCIFLVADKVSKHRRVKHKNGDKMTTKNATVLSSNNKNVEVSKSVGFKSNSRIDDRTITRRAKGEEHSTAQTEKDDESTRVPTYRAQSAKNRETSRYYYIFIYDR